jgi:hypothetical protein
VIRLAKTRLFLADTSGSLHLIRGLPLLRRAEFYQVWVSLVEMVGDRDVRSAYDSDPLFSQLVDRCLRMHGIDPGWVGIRTASELLIDTGGGNAKLIEFNYPQWASDPYEEKLGALPDHVDVDAYDLALLWAYCSDPEQAIRMGESVPWIELCPTIQARAWQLRQSDETYLKRKKAAETAEEFDALKSSGKLDQIFEQMRGATNGKVS